MATALANSSVSWCARLRPCVSNEVVAALGGMGLVEEDETLFMAKSGTVADVKYSGPGDLTLQSRRPEDDKAIAAVLGAAFDTPPLSAAQHLDPAHLGREGIEWHVGKVDGVPVTCAMSVVAGDAVGIFAVGTIHVARAKGYASAVTSRALAHGFAAGALFGVLTASPEVKNVYERLGFSVVERWRRLVPSR